MEVLRSNKTADLPNLESCVVPPPKPTEPASEPLPQKPRTGTTGKSSKPQTQSSNLFPKPTSPTPTIGDRIVKILTDKAGLGPMEALDVWVEIEKVLQDTSY
jgi:hypothetical protein